jgi:choline monooxygenase
MTDLSLAHRLQLQTAPLHVSSYFDAATLQAEQQHIFSKSPIYVGHALSVPHIGDYYALPQEHEGRVLMHTPSGVELISNVCRHRQAIMLRGQGHKIKAISSARSIAGRTTALANTPPER